MLPLAACIASPLRLQQAVQLLAVQRDHAVQRLLRPYTFPAAAAAAEVQQHVVAALAEVCYC
jgi:hypothetical protein